MSPITHTIDSIGLFVALLLVLSWERHGFRPPRLLRRAVAVIEKRRGI